METNELASPPTTQTNLAARIGWLVLILATLYVCYFSHLGAIGFVGPDEPRYAWIARAMAETGDWVTPRLYGQPWFEKPPLYYWGAALSFKLFGVSEAAARLPSAVSALLATLALAWLALQVYGAETARWLLLLLPTTAGMIGFSHAAATDMPFSAMFTIAMVAAFVLLRLIPPRNAAFAEVTESTAESSSSSAGPYGLSTYFAAALFGFFLGLAVLAKGPAGIILCGGAIFFWALITKRWRDALRLLHPAAIVTFCASALPWYILCALRNPDFFHIFIIEHNFKRFLTPEFQHTQPFWFYVPVFLFAMFPWSLLAVLEIGSALRTAWRVEKSTLAYLMSWFGFTVVFFTLSRSKLPGYILPALPALILLSTRLWTERSPKNSAAAAASFLTGVSFIAVAAILAGKIKHSNPSPFAEPWLWRWAAGIAIAGLLVCALAVTRRNAYIAAFTCALVVLGLELSNCYLLPRLDDSFSARELGTALSQWMDDNRGVCIYELRRSWIYGLDFYSHREIPECVVPPSSNYLAIVSERGLEDLVRVEREHPNSFYVHLVTAPPLGEQMRFVEILKSLPGRSPRRRQPQ